MNRRRSVPREVRFGLLITLGSSILAHAANAQVTSTGLPFLLIPASVQSHALGHISTLPNGSVMSARANPSLTALQAFDTQVQGAFYAPATDWLPGFGSSITFSAQGLMYGSRIGGESDPDWALGLGYGRVYLDLGRFAQTVGSPEPISTFRGWEEAHSFSGGLAYAGPVTVGIGMAFTFIRSNLAPFGTALESPPGPAKVTSWTYGATVQFPISRMLDFEQPVAGMIPFAAVTTTLVISDVGGSIRYGDVIQSDPLPRAATMGLSVSGGIRGEFSGIPVRYIEVEVLREAQDILVQRSAAFAPGWQYQTGLGDLKPISDVMLQSGNTIVEHRKGFRVSFAESVSITDGSFRDSGFQHVRTSGVGFSSRGLFLIFRSLISGEGFGTWILERVSLDYQQATYDVPGGHPLDGTDFQSFTVTIHGPHAHASF